MLSSDEMWAIGQMTWDEYEAEEGRPPPGNEETRQILDALNERDDKEGATHARTHS